MSLNNKILLLIVSALSLFILSFLYFWKYNAHKIDDLQNIRVQEFQATFGELLDLHSEKFQTMNYDYSYWDELVSFVESKNHRWAEVNLKEPMHVNHIDYCVVYDTRGQVVHYDQSSSALPDLRKRLPLSTLSSAVPLFSYYFIVENGYLIQVFSSPIQPSSDFMRQSPPKGYFVIAKVWSPRYIADLAKITKQSVELAKNGKTYDFLYPLASHEGKAVAHLGVRLTTATGEIVDSIFKTQLVFILAVGIIFVALLSLILLRLVTKPLKQIAESIRAKDPRILGRLPSQHDEMGNIARAVSDYFTNTAVLENYKTVIDLGYIVSKTDRDGYITYTNKAFETISGFSAGELIGNKHNITKHPDLPREFYTRLWSTLLNGDVYIGIIKNRAKDGKTYYLRSVIAPIYSPARESVEYISIAIDVTELFVRMEQIARQTTDSLTGLPNRQQLTEDLAIEGVQSLALLNIKRFRAINESYGYETGDMLLRQFAHKLNTLVSTAKIYRVSGDEFALLFDEGSESDVRSELGRIINHLESEPFDLSGTSLNVDLLVAYARSENNLRMKCDMALHYAKVNHLSFIDFNRNVEIENELKQAKETTALIQHAIKYRRIIAFGQKIFNTRDNSFKIETLMRLVTPSGEILTPYRFLEQSKIAGLYEKMTLQMLACVFDYFKGNQAVFSVNLTFEDIVNNDVTAFFFNSIEKYALQGRIIIELVETEQIDAAHSETGRFIERAKALGCRISIDDFGSGYSNFNYLVSIGVDYLKIDGSLIQNIDTDPNAFITVKAIVSLAQAMGIEIVAEFVHSQSVMERVVSLGIEFMQGYHLHEPEPLETLLL